MGYYSALKRNKMSYKLDSKIGRRNINNLRYPSDTTLMAERRGTKEPLDEGEGESERASLKLNIKKT